MKQRPILFNGAMVRAILSGQKTQTRRALRWQPIDIQRMFFHDDMSYVVNKHGIGLPHSCCPFGNVSDQLWVRETWRTDDSLNDKSPSTFASWPVKYEADGKVLAHGAFHGNTKGKTRVSIHMPRWASRITLEITGVRVEKLQEVSNADALSEGILSVQNPEWEAIHFQEWRKAFDAACTAKEKPPIGPQPREAFSKLWNSIYGSWEANPWVWVIEFKRVEQ